MLPLHCSFIEGSFVIIADNLAFYTSQQPRLLHLPNNFRQSFLPYFELRQGLRTLKYIVSSSSSVAPSLTDSEKQVFYCENGRIFAIIEDFWQYNLMAQTSAYFESLDI